MKVLRPVIWVSRLQRTYSQGLRPNFLVELILCAGVRERHFLFGRFSASEMAGSRGDTRFEGAGDGYPACAGVRGRQEAARAGQSAILAGRPDDLIFLYDGLFLHTRRLSLPLRRFRYFARVWVCFALLRFLRQRPASWLFAVGGIIFTLFFRLPASSVVCLLSDEFGV